uniref:Uncharacterized protein n=1 Tax=Arundo donax TaxID=35708 RepID=A0A0A9AUW3_ARUDO
MNVTHTHTHTHTHIVCWHESIYSFKKQCLTNNSDLCAIHK